MVVKYTTTDETIAIRPNIPHVIAMICTIVFPGWLAFAFSLGCPSIRSWEGLSLMSYNKSVPERLYSSSTFLPDPEEGGLKCDDVDGANPDIMELR